VFLPKIVPPRTPVINKAVGDDLKITLQWASNREPELHAYHVYRTTDEIAARDIRLMTRIHTELVPSGTPATRPAEVIWSDITAIVGRPYWYRLVAIDDVGNASLASNEVRALACRLTPPESPDWVTAQWNLTRTAVHLEWLPTEPGLAFLVQRRSGTSLRWITISPWLPPDTTVFEDITALRTGQNYYRIQSRDASGNVSTEFVNRLVL